MGYKHWTLEDQPRCFNVGKGAINRPNSRRSRNHKWRAVVKRYGLRVEICVGFLASENACAWEIENVESMGTFSTNHSHDDPIDIGCNFTKGGEGVTGYVWTDAHRKKALASMKGKKKPLRTIEHRKRLSIANIGRKDTEEQKMHKSESAKKRFENLCELERHREACNSASAKQKHSMNARNRSKDVQEKISKAQSLPIAQLDIHGEIIAVFPSASAAAHALGTSQGNISRAARSGYLKSAGFRWKYII